MMASKQEKRNKRIAEEIRQALLAKNYQVVLPQNLPDAWLNKLRNDYINFEKSRSGEGASVNPLSVLDAPLMIVGQLCMVKRQQDHKTFNVPMEEIFDSVSRYGLAIKSVCNARAKGQPSHQYTFDELG